LFVSSLHNVVYAFLNLYESQAHVLAFSDLTASQAGVMIHTDLAIHHNDTSTMPSNCCTAGPYTASTASLQTTVCA